jgi:hypothetical protein
MTASKATTTPASASPPPPAAFHGDFTGLPQPFHGIAVLLLIVAVWLAMWHVFLKHVPVLANLKAVLLGERTLPPRGKTRRTTFRDPNAPAKSE